MPRQSLHETTFPRVREYLTGLDRGVTVSEVAEFLEVVPATANGILSLMEVFKMVRKEKRGRKFYYVLSDVDDEQMEAMLPPRKVAPRTRRRRSRSRHTPVEEGVEEYLVAIRERTGEGPSALSIIGLQPRKDEEAEGK